MHVLHGKLVSGRGDFGLWIARLSDLYEQKTGMRLYPGTLNVELPTPYALPASVIRLEAAEYSGRVSVNELWLVISAASTGAATPARAG